MLPPWSGGSCVPAGAERALNSVNEPMRNLGPANGDMWEVAVWEGCALAADDREVYLTFQVHNEAIVVPETIDCIRTLTGIETDATRSMAKTDSTLGVTKAFLSATTQPIAHQLGPNVPHPAVNGVSAARAEFMDVGFKGSEEPTEPVPTRKQTHAPR